MQMLNRNVLDDAIRTVEHSDCLPVEGKARLLLKLQVLRDSFCHQPCGQGGCVLECHCQRMVRRLFATDATPIA